MAKEDRHSLRSWARRLGGDDEPLTLSEALLFATIAQTDRTLETLTVLQDIQARLLRMEIFLARIVPDYDAYAGQAIYKSLTTIENTGGNHA